MTWELMENVVGITYGKDGGASELAGKSKYDDCIVAEYVWADVHGVPRSKTRTLSRISTCCWDLPVWKTAANGSDIHLVPRAIFKDPFRKGTNVLVLAECFDHKMRPAIGNTRAECFEVMDRYASLEPWFGIEQEYTLMAEGKVGCASKVPFGFNKDGSEPAKQGPYYCGVGCNIAIGRAVAESHYSKCLYAGVKVTGVNAGVMPGQWEYQIGPCLGIQMGDHLLMSRYILHRVTEEEGVQVSFDPKPCEQGDWNGAGCHTNFSVAPMRASGGFAVIEQVCEAFGAKVKEHMAVYGADNDKRLTGKHATCGINTFTVGVADRGASIRIPREAQKTGKGYMEDRRPAANCDPYMVTARMMLTAGSVIVGSPV
jgi:glutamine synthetase